MCACGCVCARVVSDHGVVSHHPFRCSCGRVAGVTQEHGQHRALVSRLLRIPGLPPSKMECRREILTHDESSAHKDGRVRTPAEGIFIFYPCFILRNIRVAPDYRK